MPSSSSSSGQESSTRKHRKGKKSHRHRKTSHVSNQLKELTGAVTTLVKSLGERRSRSRTRRCSSSSNSPPSRGDSSSSIRSIEYNPPKRRRKTSRSISPSTQVGRSDKNVVLGTKSHTDSDDRLKKVMNGGEKFTEEVLTIHPDLDDDDIRLFGDAAETANIQGAPLHPKIATRWEEIAVKGLSAGKQKELVEKCFTPSNCSLIGAPKLNREIATALSAYTTSRDKQLFEFQTQIAQGMSELGKSLSHLFAAKKENETLLTEPVTSACNAAQIFLNVQHSLSVHRRQIITPNIKTALKDVVTDNPIRLCLFGDDLLEKKKKAEDLSKAGASMTQVARPTVKSRTSASFRPSSSQKKATGSSNTRPLNYRRPLNNFPRKFVSSGPKKSEREKPKYHRR